MSAQRRDSGSPQLDPRETKILSDILALVLDEQHGASENALNAIKQRATRNSTTGGALKNLFTRLINASADPTHDQRHIAQLTQRLHKAEHDAQHSLRQIETLRTALHNALREQKHLRLALSEKSSPFEWSKATFLIAAFIGLLLGIAGAEIVHTFTAAPTQSRPLYFR